MDTTLVFDRKLLSDGLKRLGYTVGSSNCDRNGLGPKTQAGLTELRGPLVFNQGETDMGDRGSKDKGKKEQQKKAQLSPKEK